MSTVTVTWTGAPADAITYVYDIGRHGMGGLTNPHCSPATPNYSQSGNSITCENIHSNDVFWYDIAAWYCPSHGGLDYTTRKRYAWEGGGPSFSISLSINPRRIAQFLDRRGNPIVGLPYTVRNTTVSCDLFSGVTDENGKTLSILTEGRPFLDMVLVSSTATSGMFTGPDIKIQWHEIDWVDNAVRSVLFGGRIYGNIKRSLENLQNTQLYIYPEDTSNTSKIENAYPYTDSSGNYDVLIGYPWAISSSPLIHLRPNSEARCIASNSPSSTVGGSAGGDIWNIVFDGRPTVQVATARTLMGTWSYSGGFTDGSTITTAKKLALIVTAEQTGTSDRQVRITYKDGNDATQTIDAYASYSTDEVSILNVSAKDVTNVENLVGTTDVSIEVREFSELSDVEVFCYPDTHTFTDLGTFTIGSGFADGATGGEYGGKIRGLVTTAINGSCIVTVTGTDPNGTSRTWIGTVTNLAVGDTFSIDISSSTFKPIKNVTNITVSGDATAGAFKIQSDNLVWWGRTDSNGTTSTSVSGGGAPVYTGNYDFEGYKQGYSVQAKTEASKFCRWFEQLLMSSGVGVFSILTKDNSLLIFYAK